MKPNWKLAAMALMAGSLAAMTTAQGGQAPGPAEKAVKLKRVFKEGVSRKYKLEVKMGPEASEETPLELVILSLEKLVKVNKDGSANYETKQLEMKISYNGQEVPAPTDANEPDLATILPNNRTLNLVSKSNPDEEMNKRIVQAMTPVFQDKELAIGEAWTTEFKADAEKGWPAGTATDKVTGFETVDGVRCAVISHTYAEAKAGENGLMKVKTTVYLDAVTGDLVKSEGVANGLVISQMGPDPMKMTFKMVYQAK